MKLNKICMLILGLAFINASYAVQEFQVSSNAEIDAIISDHDVSRISIVGGKIKKVKLASNQLKVDTDDVTGQIFVYPLKENRPVITTTKIGQLQAQTISGSMISLFLIDEAGNSFNLRLRMQSVPSETILIKPVGSYKMNGSTDFTTQVVTIIEDMYLDRKSEDSYVVSEQNMPIKLWKEVDFELYKTYGNDLFLGSVFILRNKSDKEITLAENQFWKPNTVAISIEKPVLQPGEVTKVFVIGAKQDE